jgi:NADPH:quinone reductase-like Zn-dependent oxidoreductase
VTGIVDHVNGPKLGIHDSGSSETVGAFDAIQLAADMAAAGEYATVIGPTFDLDQIGDAQAASYSGTHGKVIVSVSEPA